jgi:drug/metabolite transporter (DMT)-like permease
MIPFLVMGMSWCILGEVMHRYDIGLALLSFAGVLIIIFNTQGISSEGSVLGIIAITVNVILTSGIFVICRCLKGVDHSVLASFQSIGMMILSSIAYISHHMFTGKGLTYPNTTYLDWFLLIFNGVLAFFCQLAFLLATKLDPASRCASLIFTGVVFGYLADLILFDSTP